MCVEVVLSDMSAPWDQTSGYMSNTLTNPYRRLMNTSGVAFRDHAGSMVCLFGLRCEPNVLFFFVELDSGFCFERVEHRGADRGRTFVRRRYNLQAIPLGQVGILCASFTRGARTRSLRRG